MTTGAAATELMRARALFRIISDHEETALLSSWERLVKERDVKGKGAHDARLVAAMRLHNLTHILTFNAPDFQRYPDLTVIAPHQIAASSR